MMASLRVKGRKVNDHFTRSVYFVASYEWEEIKHTHWQSAGPQRPDQPDQKTNKHKNKKINLRIHSSPISWRPEQPNRTKVENWFNVQRVPRSHHLDVILFINSFVLFVQFINSIRCINSQYPNEKMESPPQFNLSIYLFHSLTCFSFHFQFEAKGYSPFRKICLATRTHAPSSATEKQLWIGIRCIVHLTARMTDWKSGADALQVLMRWKSLSWQVEPGGVWRICGCINNQHPAPR